MNRQLNNGFKGRRKYPKKVNGQKYENTGEASNLN